MKYVRLIPITDERYPHSRKDPLQKLNARNISQLVVFLNRRSGKKNLAKNELFKTEFDLRRN